METIGYIELTVVFVTFIFSVISIVGSVAFRLYYHRKIDLEYLGWGILLSAVWNITNSMAGNTLFHFPPAVADLSFFIMCLMPIPFLFYMDEVQKGRYHKWYKTAELLFAAECVAFAVMYLLHFWDSAVRSVLFLVCLLLFVLIMAGTIFADLFRGYIREYFVVAAGMTGVWIVVFVRFVSYFQRRNVNSDAVLPAGLVILLLLAAVNTIHGLVNVERKRQQALMASEAKGRFLANMSHEIRTPINAVLGMDAMILRECRDAAIREYALDIQNAGQNLLALVNDILDLSKIESGKLEILPEEYDISSLLHDIMNMISVKAKDKGLTVDLSVDETLPSRYWGDDTRIRQVLVNIMNNAVKYTERGGVTLTVCGEMADDSACSLTFQVKDTGIGIRQEDLAKLFQEFQRIEEERNRNIEGTGLGMSITTQLLEMMGSKLEVESVYGKGSTFYFTLEQKVIDAEPIGNLGERIKKRATEYSYRVAFTAPEAQVLVVDDNSVNRKVFVNLLKETKVKIDEAGGGMECIRMTGEKKYDVIFMDHMMPDLNGIETLHRLREQKENPCHSTPVIALTANAISGAREMYLKEGFETFLSKPIIPEKLENMLMQLLPEDKIVYEEVADDSPEDVAGSGGDGLQRMGEGGQAEELPSLDGIDWEYALLHLKDAGILKDTVNQFYLAMDRESEELGRYFQMLQDTSERQRKEAMEQYEIKVHAMKSNALMIGAVSLSGVAKMLEYAARDGETEVLQAVTPVFLTQWKKMKEILGNYVDHAAEDGEADRIQADWGEIRRYLHQIVEAMKDMDIDTADEGMGRMNQYRYPEQVKPIVDRLGIAVTDIDVKQAEKWAGELEKIMDEMEEM